MLKNNYLFWIFDDNLFLGGGITRHKSDGDNELKWRKEKHPNAVIVWEDEKFSYGDAHKIAFIVAKTVQRIQPGIRESALPSLDEYKRQIYGAFGIQLPSPEDNIKRLLGEDVVNQIIEKGHIEIETKKPKQLKGGK